MKKLPIVLLFLFIVLPFAFSGSFGFGIAWYKTNGENTTLKVYDYAGENQITTKSLAEASGYQEVFMIEYTTNKGGQHTLSYKATPFLNGSYKAGYTLKFIYNNSESELVVGDTEDEYPVDSTVATVMTASYGIESHTFNIYAEASLTDLANMASGDWSSTITIIKEAL